MQELLAKARAKLSSLQMQEVYEQMETNGDVIGVSYRYQKVAITFENGKTINYDIWQ